MEEEEEEEWKKEGKTIENDRLFSRREIAFSEECDAERKSSCRPLKSALASILLECFAALLPGPTRDRRSEKLLPGPNGNGRKE